MAHLYQWLDPVAVNRISVEKEVRKGDKVLRTTIVIKPLISNHLLVRFGFEFNRDSPLCNLGLYQRS